MRIINDAIATSSKTQLEKGQEKERESSSSSDEEEEEIERVLADVTFEELQKARSNGSHTVFRKPEQDKKAGRANKNRPMEVSCKKPVSRFKEVVQAPKRVVRDPRFESLCGALDEEGFRKRYSFLYEENLPAEKEELEKQVKKLGKREKKLKKMPDLELKEELKNHISLIDKRLKSEPTKTRDAAILAKHKKEEREAAKKGKQPFYLKKSEIRKQRLVEKFNKLKASGKLESFIEKRRKRNASKDHRYMPYRRPENKEYTVRFQKKHHNQIRQSSRKTQSNTWMTMKKTIRFQGNTTFRCHKVQKSEQSNPTRFKNLNNYCCS